MKTKYRVLSMLLCMVMLLTMLPVGAMAAEGMGNFKLSKTYTDTFTDVSADDWFYYNVKNAYEYGLMKGNSASIFNPNGNVTLAETITVAARLHAIYHTGKESFSNSNPWYKAYADYCMKNEIIEAAYSDYSMPATRAQFAAVLAAALPNAALKEINDVDDNAIPDVDMDADYAKAVYKLYRAGILTGNDAQGTFAPKSAIRRSEVAAIVSRMADPYLRESIKLSAPGGGIAWAFPSFGGGSGGKSYTVTFDANGSDVENLPVPQRVRAGQCADEPSAPTKVIHEFDGWYTDSGCTAAFDFDEPINKDTTLYAKWDITIYSKDLDPDHVKTGTLTFEGEEYEGQYIDNELIVIVKDGTTREDVEELVAPYGGTIVGQIPKSGCYQVEFDTAKTVDELNSIISSLEVPGSVSLYINNISEYTPNAYYPNDLTGRPVFAEYGEFYHVSWETALWGQSACNVPQAWELVKSVNDNPTIRLGFIDETFDANHEDLNIIEAYCHGDAFNPYTVAEKDLAVAEHGTHVAGIMGAQSDNKMGISGVALNAKLYGTAVKTKLVGVTISACDFAWAKDYAIMIEVCTNGGKEPTVINTSFGAEGNDGINLSIMNGARVLVESIAAYHDLGYKFLLIQAAGNDGTDEKDDTNYNSMVACVSEDWLKDQIIVVGNAANAGLGYGYYRAKKSSYKGGRVDVMAPGTDIFSTMPKNSYSKKSSDGSAMNGTSMAAPFVAGLAGLIWEANPNLSAERVKEIIVQTANIDVTDSEANMVNAEDAVIEALGYDPRTKEVTLKFIDTATNSYLTCNNVTAKVVAYAGWGDQENLFDEREIGLIHMSFTDGEQSHSQGQITLPYGTYEMKFSAEGYQDTILDWDNIQDAEFVVDDDAEEIIISMTPVGTTPPIVPPEEDNGYMITGEFVYLNESNVETSVSFAKCVLTDVTNSNILYFAEVNDGILSNEFFTEKPLDGTYRFELLGGDADEKGFYSYKIIDAVPITGNHDMGKVYCSRVADVFFEVVNADGEKLNMVGMEISKDGTVVDGVDGFWHSWSSALEKGTYTLTLTCDGYETYTTDFAVNGTTDLGTICLDVDTLFDGGNGTKTNPYKVSTPEQLDAVRNNLSAHYIQTSDIDMSSWGVFTPIGVGMPSYSTTLINPVEFDPDPFTGSYDGDSFKITGLTISENTLDCVGLFSGCGEDSVLTNIVLENATLNVDKSATDYTAQWEEGNIFSLSAGLIAGYSSGTVSNCSVSGKIVLSHCNNVKCGGIVGIGDPVYCVNHADISVLSDKASRYANDGDVSCGGISGSTNAINSRISYCLNYGDITVVSGSSACCGGISGEYGQITYSINYGNVRAEVKNGGGQRSGRANCNVGGIFGVNSSNNTSFCINYGEISSIAYLPNGSIYSGNFAVAGGIGGASGYYETGSVHNCYNAGISIVATKYVGSEYDDTYRVNDGSAGRVIGEYFSGYWDTNHYDNYSSANTTTNGACPDSRKEDNNINGADVTAQIITEKEAEILSVIQG